ncbi:MULTISPECIES: ABC transporter permease [Vitreoscilla]|uniref:ABC transporter permease n=1 Tax=Vitreoscilla stercoraria TaxID=61 RepID=A0ABY4ECZ1_VITST|nr:MULTISPECIES: ABC transporter permease [Vitreoscilla]AUZ05838.1 ABC transporter permease [Vitreoscilla sp. C1]UOO92790.1 ABC transporter permease [Vitreoscilla stercoraria]
MSMIALFGALETGLIYALVALGVYISFRILDFPDLTADGSFPLGGAVAAVCIVNGVNPWLACGVAVIAGALAGMLTAWMHVSLKILQLLAGILVMVALYSVNLRIMGSPNVPLIGEASVYSGFVGDDFASQYWIQPLVILGFVIAAKFLMDWFFSTQTGLAMRATGANARMARAQGVSTNKMVILGMALSNGLIALGGALFVQTQGGADISIGIGTIVIGLAAVIIGETLIPSKKFLLITISVVIGAVLYRLFIALALGSDTLRSMGFGPQDLNLVTALLVVLALRFPQIKSYFKKVGKPS